MSSQQSVLLKVMFLMALAGTAGSLFFGEVLGYPPCVLCWYQRICLYPLVVIFGGAIWSEDRGFSRYSLPLIAAGLSIAVYHNLLYYGVVPDSISPCKQGVSCTEKQVELFGFVTIPLMSLFAFLILGILNIMSQQKRDQ